MTRICRCGEIIVNAFYGIPGSDRRGFKVADDTRGPGFDPTSGERVVSLDTLRGVREHLAFRFPALEALR